jgi:plasmid stabilization system protein ParE
MALEIVWTKTADKKFDKILDYLSEEWGEKITTAFVKKVYDFLDILSEFPEIGSIEHKYKEIRGFVIIKQVSIFYSVQKNKIVILSFFENRQSSKQKRF